MNQLVRPDITIASSACPHDCPVDLRARRRGDRRPPASAACAAPEDNDYTAGVICAKVARYAERIHHPDRLMQPLLRRGPKGSGQFAPISWDDALDLVAEKFLAAEARHGRRGRVAVLLRRHHGA
jgi:anaerobic selenocysteine-containing dehydrogenase